MMGTAAVAIGAAAAIPGTLVNLAAGGGDLRNSIRTPIRHYEGWRCVLTLRESGESAGKYEQARGIDGWLSLRSP